MEGKHFSRRRSFWAMLFVIAIAHLIGGCGFLASRPLEVSLAPQVSTPSVNIGGGTKIYLSVLDQRLEKNLGSRVDDAALDRIRKLTLGNILFPGEARGTISPSEDFVEVIQKSLRSGLASLGFETLAAPEASAPTLKVSVQDLRYSSLWPHSGTGGSFNGTIVGKLYKGDTLPYEKSYSYSLELRPSSFGPIVARSWFEENFNAALSDLMSQLLADLELLKALR